jgi:hypothetical protein
MSSDPERDLEQFLAGLPPYQRKAFEEGISSLTEDECIQACRDLFLTDNALRTNYERLVRPIPAKWKDYRERKARDAAHASLIGMPANPKGRPRRDALADEAAQLYESGLSYAQVAVRLNQKYGEGTATADSVRKLIKSRKAKSAHGVAPSPDKTPK